MKRLLSIATPLTHDRFDIVTVTWEEFARTDLQRFDAVIVSGGDGSIRRCVRTMHAGGTFLPLLVHPKGSFNVVARQHGLGPIETTLDALASGNVRRITRPYYSVNGEEVFLFSAGNMGDLHHIFIAETLRFGILEKGAAKYLLAFFALLPLHLLLTPFMLMSKRKFFIFTPLPFPGKLGSFYSDVASLDIDTGQDYNFLELDGDIVVMPVSTFRIRRETDITLIAPFKK